jgi:hypothetical protein
VTVDISQAPTPLPSQVNGYLNLILSHLATVIAGALVSAGALQSSQSAQFVTIASGLLLYAVGQGYSFLIQYYRRKQATAAVASALAAPATKVGP